MRKRNRHRKGGGWAGHSKASVGKTPFGFRERTISSDLFKPDFKGSPGSGKGEWGDGTPHPSDTGWQN